MAKSTKPKKSRPTGTAMTAARLIEPKPFPTYDEIADRAYRIWLTKGCPDGEDQSNWYEAENQLILIG